MSEQPPQDVDLAQELRELGRQLGEALRVAREHPQMKEFERQVSQALGNLSEEIDRVIQSLREDERVRQAGTQAKQAAQSFKESGAAEDIARGIAKGVRALNEQIRRAIEEAERQSKT